MHTLVSIKDSYKRYTRLDLDTGIGKESYLLIIFFSVLPPAPPLFYPLHDDLFLCQSRASWWLRLEALGRLPGLGHHITLPTPSGAA